MSGGLTWRAVGAALLLLVSWRLNASWHFRAPQPLPDDQAIERFLEVVAPFGAPRVHGVVRRPFMKRYWVDGRETLAALEAIGESDLHLTCVNGRPHSICFRSDGSIATVSAPKSLGATPMEAAAKAGFTLPPAPEAVTERDDGVIIFDRGTWRDKQLLTVARRTEAGIVAMDEQLGDRAAVRREMTAIVERFEAQARPIHTAGFVAGFAGFLWVLPFLGRLRTLARPWPLGLATTAALLGLWEGNPAGVVLVVAAVWGGWLVLNPSPARAGDLRRSIVRGSAWAALAMAVSTAVHIPIETAGWSVGLKDPDVFEWSALLMPLQAGLFEELWFRGVLIAAPLSLLGRRVAIPAILIGLAIFAAMHLTSDYLRDPWWIRLLDTGLIGAILTAAAWRHGLATAAWAHVVIDLLIGASWTADSMPCAILAFGALGLAAVWPTPVEPRPRSKPFGWW